MAVNARIEELRRRILKDPASILFAQLADECLRLGYYEEAVRVCREGLEHHPDYLSGHVTLARSLMELGRFDESEEEFACVLRDAPDHLVALRGRDDLRQRRAGYVRPRPDHSETVARVLPIPPPQPAMSEPPDLVLAELEAWLAAIVAARR